MRKKAKGGQGFKTEKLNMHATIMGKQIKLNVRERFASLLSEHADPKLGITNDFVKDACLWICPQIAKKRRGPKAKDVYFSGVFTSDSLESAEKKSKKKPICTFIINTVDPLNEESGHFIFIERNHRENKSYYMDSFGRECSNREVKNFLFRSPGSSYEYICEPIQHRASTACGLYTLLYTLAAEADIDIKSEFTFLPPKVEQGDLNGRKDNDKRCIMYINRILDEYVPNI